MKQFNQPPQYPNPTDPSAIGAQFGVSPIPAHTHNGIDSQLISASSIQGLTSNLGIYAGTVTSAGAAGSVFPSGWSVTNTGTGNYTITHTLGTANFVVVVCAVAQEEAAALTSAPTSTQITVNISYTGGAGYVNSPFHFIVTTI